MRDGPRRLLLASASPRRHALLGALGVPFEVVAADVDEAVAVGEEPAAAAVRLATAKAAAAAGLARAQPRSAGFAGGAVLVLGADTIVAARDGGPPILGKPRDAAEAAAMLFRLRGRRHDVVTGVAIVDAASGRCASASATTAVWMRCYGDDEVTAYIASGDPFDKAGGYAIQHAGFHPVAALVGSEANVIGLPLGLVRRLLQRMGAPVAS